MYKHKGIVSALLVSFAGLIAFGQESPLKVEIKLAHATANNYEPFSVATAIRNTGTEDQTVDVWSCSYPTQWTGDIPSVRVNLVGCKKNDLQHLKLKPGEACERPLSIRIELPAGNGKPEAVTFRMGFKTATLEIGKENIPVWSNAVTVSVTK
jgi:hypothetical protein